METRPAELGASARSCCRHDGPTTPLRQATGKGHPYPPEVVEAVRALVEGTNLPMRVIAARIGVSRDFVKERRARHGWVRPGPARVSMVGRRGGGPRIVPEVVEAARQLIERTPLSYRGVAAWTGVSRTALRRWCRERGWRRSPEAPAFPAPPRPGGPGRPTRYIRVPGQPYAADAVGEARRLLMQTTLSQAAIARRIGVSDGWVARQLRRCGGARPPGVPRGRRPFGALVRAEARLLWEETLLPTALIGARLGPHPVTIATWAKRERWQRPPGRLTARKLRGYFGTLRAGRPRPSGR